MYRYNEITHVHLEITTRCNAGCPMCARNAFGRVAPGLQLTELTDAKVRTIFPEAFIQRLDGIDICGAYGDPAVAKDLVKVVSYIKQTNSSCRVTIFTNGGPHRSVWWRNLASVLEPPSQVVFAIDGLDDTNETYRRGVPFRRVIEN